MCDLLVSQPKVPISVVIPTYGRETVLIDTLRALMPARTPGTEIVLVDQTRSHAPEVSDQLDEWQRSGVIRWIRQPVPSIPQAMNRGAVEARGEILLFLDDDIAPDSQLIQAHLEAHDDRRGDIIAGRVLQPWHDDDHETHAFTSKQPKLIGEFMGGNFSLRRDKLLACGGFDENFKGAAYRFEREFADRLLEAGGTIWYEPKALIRHLHHPSGGTRSRGDHLTSLNPSHPVGAYYYLLVSRRVQGRWAGILMRMLKSVKTKHHLHKPWYIPITLLSEITGLVWALSLRMRGPSLMRAQEVST